MANLPGLNPLPGGAGLLQRCPEYVLRLHYFFSSGINPQARLGRRVRFGVHPVRFRVGEILGLASLSRARRCTNIHACTRITKSAHKLQGVARACSQNGPSGTAHSKGSALGCPRTVGAGPSTYPLVSAAPPFTGRGLFPKYLSLFSRPALVSTMRKWLPRFFLLALLSPPSLGSFLRYLTSSFRG